MGETNSFIFDFRNGLNYWLCGSGVRLPKTSAT